MQTVDLRLVDGRIAATAYLPDADKVSGCVIFAAPGGGYGRRYYDLRFEGRVGYSQAEHHTARGHVVIAYDHLGVGDSDTRDATSISIEDIADANHEAVIEVQALLRDGRLNQSFPTLPRAFHIGLGQSMGGGVSIIMQARRRSFDAIAVLGYSAIHTILPQRDAAAFERARSAYAFKRETPAEALSVETSSASVADFVYPFHWEDVPEEILQADMEGGYPLRRTAPSFGSLTIPNCVVGMMARGYVREDAAQIQAPVFLGYGERDTSPVPHAEPGAFPAATDISLLIVPRMAHMHNFAGTRHLLWDRLSAWAADRASAALSSQG